MARRRNRRNQGLLELAYQADWKYSAILAGASVFAATVAIPLFGRDPITAPLAALFVPLAWVMALPFAVIAVLRSHQQRRAADAAVADAASTTGSSKLPLPRTPPRPTAWSLEALDQIGWKRFEDVCSHRFPFLSREQHLSRQLSRGAGTVGNRWAFGSNASGRAHRSHPVAKLFEVSPHRA